MPIAIIVFLAVFSAPLLAQNAPPRFSHQVHLKQANLTCLACHQAATTSTAATDGNMPAEKICLACHNGNTLPRVDTSFLSEKKPAERTYRFNHQFHLQMGNAAPLLAAAIDNGTYLGKAGDMRAHLDTDDVCEGCHRGLAETEVAGKPNLPQMPDCLVCHSEIDNPFSCEKCHLEGVNLKPASHTREFADAHSTGRLGLDKTTCLPCHGRHFTCMGCH
jgi:c(7)-type cytochrome triheme protein